MFNLIMLNVDWSVGKTSIPTSRIFEYTDEHIAAQFQLDGNPLFDKLTVLPCLFLEEGTTDEIAYVGQINRARIVGREVAFEYTLDADVPPLPNSLIHEKRVELDMHHEFEFSRNHWALKDVDLYRFLLRNVRPRRQRPTVFPNLRT
ncbi:MAG TPA: hypothetical protein VHU18_12485 [Rhizomicrobium sp.]|jgi:hypothetical protein|nr:hypothetical protein [Rhizomicrobium sp.]